MKPAPVGQASIDHRGRAVDAEPQWGDHPLYHRHEMPGRVELDLGELEASTPVDPDLRGPIDENIGHLGIVEEPLNRAHSQHRVDDGAGAGHSSKRRLLPEEPRGLSLDGRLP